MTIRLTKKEIEAAIMKAIQEKGLKAEEGTVFFFEREKRGDNITREISFVEVYVAD